MKRATAGVMHAKTSSASTISNSLNRSLLDRIRIVTTLPSQIRSWMVQAQRKPFSHVKRSHADCLDTPNAAPI